MEDGLKNRLWDLLQKFFWDKVKWSSGLHPGCESTATLCSPIRELELELRHRAGYAAHPVAPGEFDTWKNDQVWPG